MSRPEEILHAFGHLPVEAILAPVKAESEPSKDSFERRIKAVNRAADQHLIQLRDSMIAQGMDRNKANAAVAGYLSADAHDAGGEGEDDVTFDRRYREELRQLLLVLNRGNNNSQQQGGGGWRAEVDYGDPRAVIFEAPPQPTATANAGGGGGNVSKRYPSPTPHHQHVSSHKPQNSNSGAAECEEDEQPMAMSPTPKYPGNQQQQRFPPSVHTTKSNAPSYNSTSRHMTASSNLAAKAPQNNSSNGTPFRPTNNGPSMRSATTTNSSNHGHHGMGSQSDAPVIVKSTGIQGNGAMIRSAKGAVGSNHPFSTANLPFGVIDVDRSSTQFAARDSDLSVRTNQSEGISAHGGAGFLHKGGGGHQNGAQTRTSVFTTPPAFKGL